MAMKFYMTPGSCSTGIHILLETLELPFEAWVLNLPAGDHLKPEYPALGLDQITGSGHGRQAGWRGGFTGPTSTWIASPSMRSG